MLDQRPRSEIRPKRRVTEILRSNEDVWLEEAPDIGKTVVPVVIPIYDDDPETAFGAPDEGDPVVIELAELDGWAGEAYRLANEDGELYVEVDDPEDEAGVRTVPVRRRAREAPRVLFPADQAFQVRRRAWEEYARSLPPGGIRPSSDSPKPVRSSPWRAALEMVSLFAAVAGLNLLVFPSDPGFRSVPLNPYLIPVLLMAVRHGTIMGFAGGLLTAAWLALLGASTSLEDGSLVLPGLVVAIGTLVGALSRHQGERLAYYRSAFRVLEETLARAKAVVKAKDAVVRDLQDRLEEHGVSLERIYRLSRGMTSESRPDLWRAMLEILARDFAVERAGIYAVREGRLVLEESLDRRPSPGERLPAELPATAGLPGLAIANRAPISVFDAVAGTLNDGERRAFVACAPVLASGRPDAVIVVQRMPLFEMSRAWVSRLSLLADWAGQTLERAAWESEMECVVPAGSDGWVDRGLGVYGPAFLADTIEREIARSRRTGAALKVVIARIEEYERIPETRRPTARRAVAAALRAHIRETDILCATQREDTLAIVLPGFEGMGLEVLAERVGVQLERALVAPVPRVRFGGAELNGHPEGAGELLSRAEAGFRE